MFVAENSPREKRGRWAMLPSLGGALAVSLAGLAFILTSATMTDETFQSWGWRLPFLLSVVLLGVGLYIRLRTEETPVFTREVTRTGTSGAPFMEALRKQRREILLGCAVEVPAYGLAVLWSLALFPIIEVGSLTTYAISVAVSTLIVGFILGPVGALMSELFHTRYRYTAAGLCYNGAGILGGAVPPLFAGMIIAAAGGFAFGSVLAAVCLVSFFCCVALPETRHRDLDAPATS